MDAGNYLIEVVEGDDSRAWIHFELHNDVTIEISNGALLLYYQPENNKTGKYLHINTPEEVLYKALNLQRWRTIRIAVQDSRQHDMFYNKGVLRQ